MTKDARVGDSQYLGESGTAASLDVEREDSEDIAQLRTYCGDLHDALAEIARLAEFWSNAPRIKRIAEAAMAGTLRDVTVSPEAREAGSTTPVPTVNDGEIQNG